MGVSPVPSSEKSAGETPTPPGIRLFPGEKLYFTPDVFFGQLYVVSR